ncbi:hypothetical protein Asi02nite_80040 [Asanoa siamensis]|uniref:Permease n=1 Tax=Asanoa siamensis TaxID=926357 RepID=A0ABQ4D4P8_9ACTN|nr:hypothetical protein Asi02nite_80040 [Asanoa siamensis]
MATVSAMAAPTTDEKPVRDGTPERGRRIGSVEILAGLLVLLVLFREPISGAISSPRLQTWTTVFVSVMVQAVPFLVFGVVLSAVIAVFVPTVLLGARPAQASRAGRAHRRGRRCRAARM